MAGHVKPFFLYPTEIIIPPPHGRPGGNYGSYATNPAGAGFVAVISRFFLLLCYLLLTTKMRLSHKASHCEKQGWSSGVGPGKQHRLYGKRLACESTQSIRQAIRKTAVLSPKSLKRKNAAVSLCEPPVTRRNASTKIIKTMNAPRLLKSPWM
jgi:hypothetical protein